MSPLQVGWISSIKNTKRYLAPLSLFGFNYWFNQLPPSTKMRIGNISRWINQNTKDIHCELYNPLKRYDIVIIFKVAQQPFRDIAEHVKDYGGRVIYDANVNYWEVWGEYGSASPKPTEQQQSDIHAMTKFVDLIVADSSTLAHIAKKYHSNVKWVPDNVDMSLFNYKRKHIGKKKLRLVWSGMSHKADHLSLITPVLSAASDIVELILVSEKEPSIIDHLPKNLKVFYFPYSDKQYAKVLANSDVIISPKRLLNAYDICHTEYKITPGMATSLPVIASPQQSYIEAISYKQSGYIAESDDEWFSSIKNLYSDFSLRETHGRNAYLTVIEKYSQSVVAKQYVDILYGM